jgi:hypothetical protein
MIAFCNSLGSCGCHHAHIEQKSFSKNKLNNPKTIHQNECTIIK